MFVVVVKVVEIGGAGRVILVLPGQGAALMLSVRSAWAVCIVSRLLTLWASAASTKVGGRVLIRLARGRGEGIDEGVGLVLVVLLQWFRGVVVKKTFCTKLRNFMIKEVGDDGKNVE